ncbi:unnamed protein product [Mucor hiemalis]
MGLLDKLPGRKLSLTATDYHLKGKKAYLNTEYKIAFSYFREGATEFNDSKCQYWVGAMYYSGQGTEIDYELAIPWLKKAAKERESALPQFLLGKIFTAGGHGVEKNIKLAEFWYNEAAKIDTTLYAYVGDIFRRGRSNKLDVNGQLCNSFEYDLVERDYLKALEWYLKANDKGRKDAYFTIAQIFHDGGFGLEKDYKQALYWFQKNVKAGNVSSCALISDIYCEGGFGVEQDYKKALSWCKKGDSFCHYKAGLMYQYYFNEPDYKNALEWYLKSLDGTGPHENTYFRIAWLYIKGLGVTKSHAEAHKYLLKDRQSGFRAYIYHYGIGAPVNFKLAFYHYKIGTENSPSGFVYNGLGLLYLTGSGVSQNYDKAMLYFQKAVDLNCTDAFNSLGDVYYYGYGVKVDYKKAFKWYEKAAKGLDDNSGQFNLGRMYHEGKGTDINYELALHWFKKASALGNERAQQHLNQASMLAKIAQENRRLSTKLLEEKQAQQARIAEAERIAKEEKQKVARLESQLESLRSFSPDNNSYTRLTNASHSEVELESYIDGNHIDGGVNGTRSSNQRAIKFFHL